MAHIEDNITMAQIEDNITMAQSEDKDKDIMIKL